MQKGKITSGMFTQSVDVFEVHSSQPLSTGLIAWCGRISFPAMINPKKGERCELVLDDGRKGFVFLLDISSTELTFVGTTL
jgi:hypothetical protein